MSIDRLLTRRLARVAAPPALDAAPASTVESDTAVISAVEMRLRLLWCRPSEDGTPIDPKPRREGDGDMPSIEALLKLDPLA